MGISGGLTIPTKKEQIEDIDRQISDLKAKKRELKKTEQQWRNKLVSDICRRLCLDSGLKYIGDFDDDIKESLERHIVNETAGMQRPDEEYLRVILKEWFDVWLDAYESKIKYQKHRYDALMQAKIKWG